MNFKEHLQLLVMMVPTILLLAAVAFSMAFPGRSVEAPSARAALVVDLSGTGAFVFNETDIGPVSSVPAR